MENFIFSLNVVLPMFFIIGLGFLLKNSNFFTTEFLRISGRLSFKIFLPTLLFYNVYHTELQKTLNLPLMLYAVASTTLVFLIAFLLVPLFSGNRNRMAVIIQGIYRSNFLLFGLPVMLNIFGTDGIGVSSMLVAVIVPVYNLLAVVALSYFGEGKTDWFATAKNVLANPLIIGTALGLIFLALKIPVPVALDKALSDIARLATPFALLLLGAEFNIKSVNHNLKALVVSCLGKLLLTPAFIIGFGYLLGFREIPLVALLAMSASPVAVSSFIMAQQAKADDQLAGQIVVFSTLLSVFTIFGWVFLLKSLGLV